jgi:hypothetical protein
MRSNSGEAAMTTVSIKGYGAALFRLLLVLLAASLFQACSNEWHLVVSEPWRFSILMPGTPATARLEAQGVQWRGQAFRLDPAQGWWVSNRPERSLSYSTWAQAVPNGWTSDSVVARLFDQRTEAVGLPNGSGTRVPIELNGIKGVELTLSLSGVQHVVRVFVVGDIAYTIEALGVESEMRPQVLSKYFDSFRVTG